MSKQEPYAKQVNRCGSCAGIVFIALLPLLFVMPACSSRWQPGFFDVPTKTENRGRITEKTYYKGDYFNVLEVDGKPIVIPNGYVEFTSYCKVKGIDAVAFSVRGKSDAPGVFILQVYGDETILERICDYKTPVGVWEGPIFLQCEVGWNAETRSRVY